MGIPNTEIDRGIPALLTRVNKIFPKLADEERQKIITLCLDALNCSNLNPQANEQLQEQVLNRAIELYNSDQEKLGELLSQAPNAIGFVYPPSRNKK